MDEKVSRPSSSKSDESSSLAIYWGVSKRTKNSAISPRQADAGRLKSRVLAGPTAGAHPPQTFGDVARLITSNPPPWLSEFLRDWSSSIMLANAVEARQPLRSEMRRILAEVHSASGLLIRALGEAAVIEFLNSGPKGPLKGQGMLDALLRQLNVLSLDAVNSKLLVDDSGKTRAGRGPAMPGTAFSSQAYCALLIAEAYRHFAEKYPAPKNLTVAKAADLLWRLSAGERRSWGSNPLTAWRLYFKKALSLETDKLPESVTCREEMRRHLRTHDAQARAVAAPE